MLRGEYTSRSGLDTARNRVQNNSMVRWILLFLLVFASSAGATDTRLPPVLHSVSAGPVTASFGGQETANDIPLRFAINHLWFTFDGDDQTYVFLPDKTPEEGDYRDWNFDIFSPNGQYVVFIEELIVAINRVKLEYFGKPCQ